MRRNLRGGPAICGRRKAVLGAEDFLCALVLTISHLGHDHVVLGEGREL